MRDYLHTIPPAMVGLGDAARETTERIRELTTGMPNLDVVLPRAMEPGELSLVGGYSGIGRSMFGDIPIHTSEHVPEGTAFLIDRSAMELRPTNLQLDSSLDRVGSTYGFTRSSDESDEDYRARLRYSLTRPLRSTLHDVPPIEPTPEEPVTPEPDTQNLWQRIMNSLRRMFGGGYDTPPEEATPDRPWRDCYMCGVRGHEEDNFHPTNGLCNECNVSQERCHRCGIRNQTLQPQHDGNRYCAGCFDRHERPAPLMPRGYCERCSIPTRRRFCEPCRAYHEAQRDTRDDAMFDSARDMNERYTNGPTAEELEATYRV